MLPVGAALTMRTILELLFVSIAFFAVSTLAFWALARYGWLRLRGRRGAASDHARVSLV